MEIGITEEKMNEEAARLEMFRAKLFNQLKKELRLSEVPRHCGQLKDHLTKLLLEDQFDTLKAQISAQTHNKEALVDYQVEHYLKNFVIEPLLEQNYQSLLQKFKQQMRSNLVPKFPLTTVVLEMTAVNAFELRDSTHRSPLDIISAKMETLVPNIDVMESFTQLANIPVQITNYFESMIDKKPDNKSLCNKLLKDTHFVVKVLEMNCFTQLSLCNRLFERVMANYGCDTLKSLEEIEVLRTDFRTYFRDMILSDTRELGSTSPHSLFTKIGKICKQVWAGHKKKLLEEIDPNKKRVIMSYQDSQMFIAAYFKFYRDEVELKLRAALSIVPRDDVFLFKSYETVRENISCAVESTIDSLAATQQQSIYESVNNHLTHLLSKMLGSGTRYALAWFPEDLTSVDHITKTERQLKDLLTLENLKAVVLICIASTPHVSCEAEYQEHLEHIQRVAFALKVHQDAKIIQAFQLVKTLALRKQHKQTLDVIKKELTNVFNHNPSIQLFEVLYFMAGLYFLISGSEPDLVELKLKTVATSTEAVILKPLSYSKRRLLLQIMRYLKNGHFLILNYQLVLRLESMIENMRYLQNVKAFTVDAARLKAACYNLDYNQVIKAFKEMDIKDLATLIEKPALLPEGQSIPREFFRSNFIADTAFNQGKMVKDLKGNTMIQVDAQGSAEKLTPSPTKSKSMFSGVSSFFSGLFSSKSGVIDTSQMQIEIAPRMSEEELMMFYGKLRYLQDSIKKCEFIELNPGVRSRCPVMCLSGFTSEDCDKADDWKQLVSLYPSTEILTINWAAMTPTRVVTALKSAIMKVDSGQIFGLLRAGISGTFKKNESGGENPDEIEHDRQRNHNELTANPFQNFQADQKGPGMMNKLFNFMGGGEKIAEVVHRLT